MSARIVAAPRGARWIVEGWQLFRAAPFLWAGALIGCAMLLMLVVGIPVVGAPLFAILTPALWAALMAVGRAAAGEGAAPGAALRELRSAARPLALLGVLYLATNVGAVAATMPFGEGLLGGWMLFGKEPAREVLASRAFAADVALAMLFYLPAMLAFWFSPMLVVSQRMGAAKALFYSFGACLLCWRAFCVYGVVAALVFFATSAFVSAAGGLLVQGAGLAPGAAMLVVMPVFMAYACVLVASVYACYRDVFAPGEATIQA